MLQVYIVNPDGSTVSMKKVYCRDESQEIQELLDKNLDLLPGDQIQPDDPRRWLLIRREMPVPDPASGQPRWAIDFVLTDQSAVPTFVECKRFWDTRSRREVVAQMLEYAANAHRYWDAETFRQFAEQSAQTRDTTLEDALANIAPDEEMSIGDFFSHLEENLRQGHIRLIFFLEEAPMELKSIVDFLNKQMERTEVLLVEAQQYELDGTRIVVPMLFGYTEEARRVKRPTSLPSLRQSWDEETFFEAVAADLGEDTFQALYEFYSFLRSQGFRMRWGTGAIQGSFNVVAPDICPRSLFTVRTTGILTLNFGWLNSSKEATEFRERFGQAVQTELGWDLPANYAEKYPNIPLQVWLPKAQLFANLVLELVQEFRA